MSHGFKRGSKRKTNSPTYTYIFVVYPTILSSSQPRHNSIPWKVVWQIYRDTEQPHLKETLHRTDQGSNFLGGSLSNRDVRAPIQFRRERQPQHLKRLFFLKNRPIHFQINSNKVIRLVKQNNLSFSRIEINKLLPASEHSVLYIRFKFTSQFWFLPQIRCLITLRVESSTISIDSNITYNIIRKVINVQQEKYWTKNGALRNCEDFPSRTTQSCLLLREDKIRPNIKLKFEEDQHTKPYQKHWTYQVLQLEQPRPAKRPRNYNCQKICS